MLVRPPSPNLNPQQQTSNKLLPDQIKEDAQKGGKVHIRQNGSDLKTILSETFCNVLS